MTISQTQIGSDYRHYGYVYQHCSQAVSELVDSGSLVDRLARASAHMCKLVIKNNVDNVLPTLIQRLSDCERLDVEEQRQLSQDILKYHQEVCARCHEFIAVDE